MVKDFMMGVKWTLIASADYMESALLRGAEKIAAALGMTRDFGSEEAARNSDNHFVNAGKWFRDIDTKNGVPQLNAAIKEVQAKAKAASDQAMGKPYLDDTKTKQERDDLLKQINPDAAKRFLNPEPAKPDPADSKPLTPQGKLIRDAKTPAKSGADTAAKDAELAARQAEAASTFDLEGKLLDAKIKGRHKLIQTVEHEINLLKTKLSLMQQQGLSEEAATAAAKSRVAQEEKAANPKKAGTNHKDTAESNKARADRRSAADKVRDIEQGRDPLSQADRLGALAKAKRDAAKADRKEKADLKRDPEKLARANKAAAEIKKAAAEAKADADNRERRAKQLYEKVNEISDNFKGIALA